MKTITAREANQAFSQLLAEVANGEEIVITRRGRPVARLVPFHSKSASVEREATVKRIIANFRKGESFDFVKISRDEMHAR